jgi:hypothetical protein
VLLLITTMINKRRYIQWLQIVDGSTGGGLLSAEQMIAQLTAASQRLGEAHARLQDATKATCDAQTMMSGAPQGSSGQLVAQIRGLIETLVQISASVPKTQEHVQQTITRVKAPGN